jgi:UDP-N-acetylglucosamine 2-epimerase (non-hydrolysing)
VKTVLTLFGTRPEVIKLAPVMSELCRRSDCFRSCHVTSAQHTHLLYPLTEAFGISLHHDLKVMTPGQSLSEVLAKVLVALDAVLLAERPDLILVQGDTTTALAGALAGFHRDVPVGHVEAGLRSGNARSPFPEEMNRRLVSRLASLHFAATSRNVETLRDEGVPDECIVLTGNPVVDSLLDVLKRAATNGGPTNGASANGAFTNGAFTNGAIANGRAGFDGTKLIVLTTHRRESFGEAMSGNLRVLREFVESHDDVSLAFPVHPNPSVRGPSYEILGGSPRIHLLEPMEYFEFVHLLSRAWLIVSDSGGVQEEAPSLGKPLLVLRENTERPEAVEAGVARLVGGKPETLREMLHELYPDHAWLGQVARSRNPFGDGTAAVQIVDAIEQFLGAGAASASRV